MTVLELSSKERRILEAQSVSPPGAKELRRALALLWLDDGDTVQEVCQRLGVSRQTVYNWVARLEERGVVSLDNCLGDGQRSGRPPTAQGIIDPLIDQVIDQDPRVLGYRATVWTAPLLKQYLSEVHQIEVCRRSIGGAIVRLGIRWKRPRHQLAYRSATWRQAKGGSNEGWRTGSEP